jgi:4-hydroxybenzoyl-CoA thioesterase
VFYPVYFRWFDEATWSFFESIGLPLGDLGARYGVVGLPLVANNAEYRRPCRLGDSLALETSVAGLEESFVVLRHRILNGGELAVVGTERRFWGLRHPENSKRLQKGKIPSEVADIIARAVSGEGA